MDAMEAKIAELSKIFSRLPGDLSTPRLTGFDRSGSIENQNCGGNISDTGSIKADLYYDAVVYGGAVIYGEAFTTTAND